MGKKTLKHTLKLLPYQKTFLQSDEKDLWLSAGLGTGKTYVACLYIIDRMLRDPTGFGLLTASTFKQLHNSILAQLTRLCDEIGLKYTFNKQESIFTLKATNARLLCMSAESYEQVRGIEFSYAVLEEACMYNLDAYNVILGRIRQKTKLPLQIRLISTPKGFNWTWEAYAEGMGDIPIRKVVKRNKYKAILRVPSYENFFLPEGYLETMAANYSSKFYAQEVEADFVSGGAGTVYQDFNRALHTYDLQDRGGDIIVGMDFNCNPMTATLSNKIEHTDGSCTLEVFDEIYLEDSNTFKMADELKRRYPNRNIIISPDASGASGKTSSTTSDHKILRDAGFTLKLHQRINPAIFDRYNTVNGRLKEGKLKIGKKCVKLIRDLEQVVHEKNPKHLTHISDALGYSCWYWQPIRPLQRRTETIKPR